MDSLTFKENTEYEVILNKLHLDVRRKQWIADLRLGVPGGDAMDDEAGEHVAVQEVLQPRPHRGVQEGHEGRGVLRGERRGGFRP